MGLLAINPEFPECALSAIEGKSGPWIARQAGRTQPHREARRLYLCMRGRVMQAEVESIVAPGALAFQADTRPDRCRHTKENQCLVHQVCSQVPKHPPARTAILPPGVH